MSGAADLSDAHVATRAESLLVLGGDGTDLIRRWARSRIDLNHAPNKVAQLGRVALRQRWEFAVGDPLEQRVEVLVVRFERRAQARHLVPGSFVRAKGVREKGGSFLVVFARGEGAAQHAAQGPVIGLHVVAVAFEQLG